MDIQQRLALFYRRLEAAPPAATTDEAFLLICRELERVEQEFCTVPRQNPPPQTFDGRMYLPQPDNIAAAADGSTWVRTRHHRIKISPGGGFVIFRLMPQKTMLRQFQKAGAGR